MYIGVKLMRIQVLDIKEVKEIVKKDMFSIKGIDCPIYIDEQKTGFGYKKFLICPACGESRTKLYIINMCNIYCRTCSPKGPYEGITHTTRGGTDEIQYRMARVAAKYKIPLKYPFQFYDVIWKRPKYMRYNKWEEGLYKLQALENMRFQTIFFKKKYSATVINRVLNYCPCIYSMPELIKYLIDWEGYLKNREIIEKRINEAHSAREGDGDHEQR